MLGFFLLLSVGGEAVPDSVLKLPPPDTVGRVTVEQALLHRRSVRSYAERPLEISDVGQVLWAAQGKTGKSYGRTAPSAGATYPMEVYLVARKVTGLEPGVYQYIPDAHALKTLKRGDVRLALGAAALGQPCVLAAPAALVLCADYSRTTGRYGERGKRYVHMEAGHIGQNVHLECEARGMGTVMVGAFVDSAVQRVIGSRLQPLYIMPFGYKR